MDKLEWSVDTVDGTTFEKLAGEILRHVGYDVHESGVIGTDGGWDARVKISGKRGIAHASTRDDWRRKLREDAKSVQELEAEQGESFERLVFVTNQGVTGKQEVDLEDEIEEEYGWDLSIIHRRHIIAITGSERPDLADRYFGFDPKQNENHIEEIHALRDERLDLISNREGIATDLVDGPAVVVHLIPNGLSNENYVSRSDNVPDLPPVGRLPVQSTETIGKGKINRGNLRTSPFDSYTYLQKDGLYEAVDTDLFYVHDDDLKLTNKNKSDNSFDFKVGIAVQAGVQALKKMGVSGTVFCFVSLLDAQGTIIGYRNRVSGPLDQEPLRTERYTTDRVEIPLAEPNIVDSIRSPLTEIWQELGWKGSIDYDDEGNWTGRTVDFGEIGQFPPDK